MNLVAKNAYKIIGSYTTVHGGNWARGIPCCYFPNNKGTTSMFHSWHKTVLIIGMRWWFLHINSAGYLEQGEGQFIGPKDCLPFVCSPILWVLYHSLLLLTFTSFTIGLMIVTHPRIFSLWSYLLTIYGLRLMKAVIFRRSFFLPFKYFCSTPLYSSILNLYLLPGRGFTLSVVPASSSICPKMFLS